MNKQKCLSCNADVSIEMAFCPKCGKKQEQTNNKTINSNSSYSDDAKNKLALKMISALVIVAAAGIAVVIFLASKNAFEAALDPYTGTRVLYNKWKDAGALDKVKKFHGVDIEQIQSSYFLNGGTLANAQFWTFASAQDMRSALAKACKAHDYQFTRIDVNRGEVIINLPDRTITCYYEANTSPNGNSMLILAKKK